MSQVTLGLQIPMVCLLNRFQCISRILYKLDLKRNIDTGAWRVHFFRVHDLFQRRKLKSSALGICLVSHLMAFSHYLFKYREWGLVVNQQLYRSKFILQGKGKGLAPPHARWPYPDVRSVIVHGVQEECTICIEDSGLSSWLGPHVTAKVRAIQSFVHMHLACRLVGSSQNLEMRWKSVTHNISTKACFSLVLYLNCGPFS